MPTAENWKFGDSFKTLLFWQSISVFFRKQCAIPGLEGRQLEFLGLMNCPYEASRRENIPAEKVSKPY